MSFPATEIKVGRRTVVNWPLLIGLVLITLITLFAIKGPDWAPRDPLEMTSILRVGDEWEVPPYSFFTPGFPLGSDQFGRDLLSQLLWAVRPTMILVLIVASMRLLLGMLVGLITGWSDRWHSRILNLAIAFGLAVPTLLVSLIVIARMGLQYGLWTFIIGLALTGWAETAQYVRDQTQLLKEQVYIEASQALGSTPAQILRHHIVRQIVPLLSMLAVFEISATLMVTAELGFLGFYLGGGVFIQIDDFITRAGLGMPELGQMLAVGLELTTEPFGLVVAGTVIFITILGFNLIGEGLRRRLSVQRVRRRTIIDDMRQRIALWVDERIYYPLGNLSHTRWGRMAGAALVVLVIISGIVVLLPPEEEPSGTNIMTEVPLLLPTEPGAIEATTTSDTESYPTQLPAQKAEILWQFPTEGLPVPPVISEDGAVHLLTHDNTLYLLEDDGSVRWQEKLAPPPHEIEAFGEPRTVIPPQVSTEGNILIIASDMVYALDNAGQRLWDAPLEAEPKEEGCCAWNPEGTDFYLLDRRAGLYAFNAQEGFKWKYTPEENQLTPQSNPLAGLDGQVYYSASGVETAYLFAVGDAGEPIWVDIMPEEGETGLPFLAFDFGYTWLRLGSQDGRLFFNQEVINAADGRVLETGIEAQLSQLASETEVEFVDHERFMRFFAEDGATYLLTSDPIIAEVRIEAEEVQFIQGEAFQEYYVGIPPDRAGVAEGRYVWVEFETFPFAVGGNNEAGLGILWMDLESSEERTLFVKDGEETIAARDESTARYYICDAQRDPPLVTCRSESIKGGDPEWQIEVEGIASIKYTTLDLDQERLYIFGRDNLLYAVELPIP